MENYETLILSKSDLMNCLTLSNVAEAVEGALKAHGEKQVVMPPKLGLPLGDKGEWPNYNAFINSMPAYIGPIDIAGIKWAGGFWDNYQRGLPSVMAVIVLTDPRTGVPKAIMEGGWITDFRTAAVSAVGAKYLARKEVETIGIYGAGTQGRTQLMVFNELYDIKEAKVFDIREGAAEKMAEEMSDKVDIHIVPSTSIREVGKASDIIITVTTAHEPFLEAQHLPKGVHISAMGSYNEISMDVVEASDKIVVDNLGQTKHRGNLARFFEQGTITEEEIDCELGEIVAGKKPGRERKDENTLLVPIGMGSEDVAVAYRAYQEASDKGIGKPIRLEVELNSYEMVKN